MMFRKFIFSAFFFVACAFAQTTQPTPATQPTSTTQIPATQSDIQPTSTYSDIMLPLQSWTGADLTLNENGKPNLNADAQGTVWKLKNGTYTIFAPQFPKIEFRREVGPDDTVTLKEKTTSSFPGVGENGWVARFSKGKLTSITACSTYNSRCLTVDKNFCESAKTAMGAKSLEDFNARIAACDSLSMFRLSGDDLLIDEKNRKALRIQMPASRDFNNPFVPGVIPVGTETNTLRAAMQDVAKFCYSLKFAAPEVSTTQKVGEPGHQ